MNSTVAFNFYQTSTDEAWREFYGREHLQRRSRQVQQQPPVLPPVSHRMLHWPFTLVTSTSLHGCRCRCRIGHPMLALAHTELHDATVVNALPAALFAVRSTATWMRAEAFRLHPRHHRSASRLPCADSSTATRYRRGNVKSSVPCIAICDASHDKHGLPLHQLLHTHSAEGTTPPGPCGPTRAFLQQKCGTVAPLSTTTKARAAGAPTSVRTPLPRSLTIAGAAEWSLTNPWEGERTREP